MDTSGQFHFEQPKQWGRLAPDGTLVMLDNAALRHAAHSDAYARFVLAVLDTAAEKVDHILREKKQGGGTYGDAIRNLTIMPPNAGNNRSEPA